MDYLVSPEYIKERFTIYEEIGVGGSGYVSKALDQVTGQIVALKICSFSQNDMAKYPWKDLLISEFQCLKKLNGISGIPEVYDFFIVEGDWTCFYISMQLISSSDGNVEDMFESGLLNSEMIDSIVSNLLRIIADVHDRNVVHRDIQLMNLMINPEDQVFVIDFGEAVDLSASFHEYQVRPYVLTTEGRFGGHSIETLKASDVYYIGRSVYLLSGFGFWKVPSSKEETEIQLEKATGSKYETIIRECLRFDPYERPTSARLRELAATL